jgi:hypothetical protein
MSTAVTCQKEVTGVSGCAISNRPATHAPAPDRLTRCIRKVCCAHAIRLLLLTAPHGDITLIGCDEKIPSASAAPII